MSRFPDRSCQRLNDEKINNFEGHRYFLKVNKSIFLRDAI